jgi:hypothetical protein
MAKSDFIPQQDTDYLAWHDQFKTNVLAQAATVRFGRRGYDADYER